jgi:hypothetical protein
MPTLKLDDDVLDVDALESAEYTEGEFESYDGEVPPKGTILSGYVKSIWYALTKNEDSMLKVLFVADGNEGDEAEYNGIPIFENAALIPSAKFRWAPMMRVLGFTLRDVKSKMVAESNEDDQFGAKLKKIGSFVPGEEAEGAWVRVVTGRERYNGEWQCRAAKWLPWEEAEAEDPDEEPEDEEAVDEAEEVDEEVDEEPEEEEPEAEPEPPARGRRSAAKPAAAAAKKPAAKAPAGRGRTAAPAKKPAASAKPARGRRPAVEDDEPPF